MRDPGLNFSYLEGRRCQRRRNQCHPNPCKNSGQCARGDGMAGSSSFSCECKAGFGGRLCEDKLHDDRIRKR